MALLSNAALEGRMTRLLTRIDSMWFGKFGKKVAHKHVRDLTFWMLIVFSQGGNAAARLTVGPVVESNAVDHR
jgi:hypothetical protein